MNPCFTLSRQAFFTTRKARAYKHFVFQFNTLTWRRTEDHHFEPFYLLSSSHRYNSSSTTTTDDHDHDGVSSQENSVSTAAAALTGKTICMHCRGEGLLLRREKITRLKRKERRKQKRNSASATNASQSPKSEGVNGSDHSSTRSPDDVKGCAYEQKLINGLQILSTKHRPHHAVQTCPVCVGTGLVDRGGYTNRTGGSRSDAVKETSIANDDAPSLLLENAASLPKPSSSSMSSPQPGDKNEFHVSIIGGGIGGCALALALCQRDISCTLYERDDNMDVRSQGYGLTMQQGFSALGSLGLVDPSKVSQQGYSLGIKSTYHAVHRSDGSLESQWGQRVWKGDNHKRSSPKRFNVHIPRQDLRRRLLDQIPSHVIQWGNTLVDVEEEERANKETNNGDDGPHMKKQVKLTLECSDPNSALLTKHVNLAVGADGIFGKVRTFKFPESSNSIKDPSPLRYLDCMVILGIAPTPSSLPDEPLLLDNETIFETLDGNARLYGMPFTTASNANKNDDDEPGNNNNQQGETMWQLSFPISKEDATSLNIRGPNALKEEALNRCKDWHDPIPKLLRSTPTKLVTGYPVFDRAVVPAASMDGGGALRGNPLSHVTLIGDAAHPMSPFKGQGANQALLDAVLLARVLHRTVTHANGDQRSDEEIENFLPKSLLWFENEMMDRSASKVISSAEAAKILHTEIAITHDNISRSKAYREFVDKNK